MSWSEYVALVAQVPLLPQQLESARQEIERATSGAELLEVARKGEEVLADGREIVAAALERSQAGLIEMGLTKLPDDLQVPTARSTTSASASEAIKNVGLVLAKVVEASAAQAERLAEFRRLQATAARLEKEERERERAAVEAEARREREAEELRRRNADKAKLSEQIAELESQRDEVSSKMWSPSKKRRVAEFDAEIQKLRDRREAI